MAMKAAQEVLDGQDSVAQSESRFALMGLDFRADFSTPLHSLSQAHPKSPLPFQDSITARFTRSAERTRTPSDIAALFS